MKAPAKRAATARTRMLASAASPPPPPPPRPSISSLKKKKKPRLPTKPSTSPKTLNPFPDLSNCHACGVRFNFSALQTLPSQWRIVLLCPKCLSSIEASDICSYCFSKVSISPGDGIDCRACDCRVHRRCLSFVPPHNSFTCVDCWLPKHLMKSRDVSDESPRSATKEENCCVQDAVEKKVAAAAKARERAAKKAEDARRAVERARKAVCVASLAPKGDERNSVLNAEELEARLHRLMIDFPRISRVLGFADSGSVDALKKEELKGSELNCCSNSGKFEVCINCKGFEKHNATNVEPSGGFSALDRNSSVELAAKGIRTVVDGNMTSLCNGDIKSCTEVGGVESFRRGLEAGAVEKLDCEGEKSDMPMREEQGSCSNKVVNSSEDDNSVESGSDSCRSQNGVKDMESSNLLPARDDGVSSNTLMRSRDEPSRYLITYTKRQTYAQK